MIQLFLFIFLENKVLAEEGKAKAIAFDEIDKAPEEKARGITIATVCFFLLYTTLCMFIHTLIKTKRTCSLFANVTQDHVSYVSTYTIHSLRYLQSQSTITLLLCDRKYF